MIQPNIIRRTVYIQKETSNKSFRDMHFFLKAKGIKKNDFFLVLYDADLAGIDPFDRHLNSFMKQKVFRECLFNYWYFLREVVRIPQEGATGRGSRFELHRGNLAFNFCVSLNMSIFFELSRQLGKTTAVICRILWEFNFGTNHTSMVFMHKTHGDCKKNLKKVKDYRECLPTYLQMAEGWNSITGKKLKPTNRAETLEHVNNGNRIEALSSASSKDDAMAKGRGMTVGRIYFDEYAFAKFNKFIYGAAYPAFKTAKSNAIKHGAPYGIIITTTPGDLTSECGLEAFDKKSMATEFSEEWYNLELNEIEELLAKNENSIFVYIRFTYLQVGKDDEWLKEAVKGHGKDYETIRREYLLEWSTVNANSPFRDSDLAIVRSLIKEPIARIPVFHNYYTLDVYETIPSRVTPIIGVDASGGFQRDSSAITIINSETTKVAMTLNCNYMSPIDLACVVIEIVTKYLPNAVVNVERNGGYGSSVLAKLVKSKIKKNLYYEIKDKIVEERFVGMRTIRKTNKTKIFGTDNVSGVRDDLMEILRQRMENHKDKFVARILYEELEALEVKKNGRIEANSTGHDDQIFSYLMALHVWYNGVSLKERWNINKSSLRTDQDLEEDVDKLEEYNTYKDLSKEIEIIEDDELEEKTQLKEQLEIINSDKSITYDEWRKKERQKDDEALAKILNTEVGRDAYAKQYHCNLNALEDDHSSYELPDDIFTNFYK